MSCARLPSWYRSLFTTSPVSYILSTPLSALSGYPLIIPKKRLSLRTKRHAPELSHPLSLSVYSLYTRAYMQRVSCIPGVGRPTKFTGRTYTQDRTVTTRGGNARSWKHAGSQKPVRRSSQAATGRVMRERVDLPRPPRKGRATACGLCTTLKILSRCRDYCTDTKNPTEK